MKVETNSVLTVEWDAFVDHDFLFALETIAKRENITIEKAFDLAVSHFFASGGEPPEAKEGTLS
ncbi:MAG: hypothetical protein FWF96_00645 [Kiritimatiellaeota bacterium]|nr:hypothetical protein [Kiritimatiellota bacterium]